MSETPTYNRHAAEVFVDALNAEGLVVVSRERYEALERHYQAVTRRQFHKSEEEYLVANVDAGHAWRQLQQMDRVSEARERPVETLDERG